jgi:hypothetical protein
METQSFNNHKKEQFRELPLDNLTSDKNILNVHTMMRMKKQTREYKIVV